MSDWANYPTKYVNSNDPAAFMNHLFSAPKQPAIDEAIATVDKLVHVMLNVADAHLEKLKAGTSFSDLGVIQVDKAQQKIYYAQADAYGVQSRLKELLQQIAGELVTIETESDPQPYKPADYSEAFHAWSAACVNLLAVGMDPYATLDTPELFARLRRKSEQVVDTGDLKSLMHEAIVSAGQLGCGDARYEYGGYEVTVRKLAEPKKTGLDKTFEYVKATPEPKGHNSGWIATDYSYSPVVDPDTGEIKAFSVGITGDSLKQVYLKQGVVTPEEAEEQLGVADPVDEYKQAAKQVQELHEQGLVSVNQAMFAIQGLKAETAEKIKQQQTSTSLPEWEKQLLDAEVEPKKVNYPTVTTAGGNFPYIHKEHTFGTPVTSPIFFPMSTPATEEDPGWFADLTKPAKHVWPTTMGMPKMVKGAGYNSAWVDEVPKAATGLTYNAVQKALNDMWQPGWQQPELTSLHTEQTSYESEATLTVSNWSMNQLGPNAILDVNGESFMVVNMTQNLGGSYNQLTINVVRVADFSKQVTSGTDAMKELAEVLQQKPSEPYYAKFNKPGKGKKWKK